MYDEVWVVAGGEPGAKRFGSFVQRLRKDRSIPVEEVASEAGLSIGTVRAVEQGRRAPSAESGIRLLDLLLPAHSLPRGEGASRDPGDVGYDYSFVDPTTEARVVVRFQARTAGDNRRWARDLPPPGETPAEAILREVLADPERKAKFEKDMSEDFLPAMARMVPLAQEALATMAARPASDESYGRLVRRLAGHNEFHLQRVEKLLTFWEKVEDGTADEHIREVVASVESALDSIHILTARERAQIAKSRNSDN